MYTKLKDFKASLGSTPPPLYFAKLDVHAAFDTIPQDAVVRLMASVPSQDEYTITRHAEIKPGQSFASDASKIPKNPARRWHATAVGKGDSPRFPVRLEQQLGTKKKSTVFVGNAASKTHLTGDLLRLLAEHVKANLVKIGKKYYRQKTGIPQGSVLSSFLCNYFYADLEIHHLDFLSGPDCLLLRLTDDFLVITSDKSKALRFVKTMHRGIPEYGVAVNPKKTLVNFDMQEEGGGRVNKLSEGEWFPYCGTRVDCCTLDVTRDWDRSKKIGILRPNPHPPWPLKAIPDDHESDQKIKQTSQTP